jgi:hypothetical protein
MVCNRSASGSKGTGLYGRQRQCELFGDFGFGATAKVSQLEDSAVFGSQSIRCSYCILQEFIAFSLTCRIQAWADQYWPAYSRIDWTVVLQLHFLALAAVATQMHQCCAAGYAIQPCAVFAVAAETCSVPMGCDHGVLGDIVGVAFIAHKAHRNRSDVMLGVGIKIARLDVFDGHESSWRDVSQDLFQTSGQAKSGSYVDKRCQYSKFIEFV